MMRSSLRRSYRYLIPYQRLILGAYAATVAAQVISLLVPQFIRWIIDQGIRQQNLRLLAWSVTGLLLLALLKGFFTYIVGKWSETASQSVAYDLRNDIQRKLTSLSFSFHDTTKTGELLSRAMQDVERIRFLTGRATLRIIDAVLILVGTIAILFWMQPHLAALVTLAMPLLIFQALHFGRRFRPFSLAIQKQLAVLTTMVEQNLRGTRVVKAFAQEDNEIERFAAQNNAWLNLSIMGARLQAVNAPLLLLIANLGVVIIMWYGGSLVMEGALTLGSLVAFMTYLSQLVEPVRRLGLIIPGIAIAASSGSRVFEILDAVPDVQDAPDAYPLPPLRGHVQFQGISFSYGNNRKYTHVLRDIDFEVQPGQIVALLGPTGSGKSTIISLVPRFYDPTAGTVRIDGHDLRRVTIRSLRTQIGIVMQETTLFAASVRQNIGFGRPEASEAEIIAAAKAAQAHEFIMQMTQGYDTHLGERGVTLSGGQKQRLAIARALLMDPAILILDDATASVDTETEQLIQKAFERLMEGRTTFVIAHRLSTVRQANLILVLDHGRIAAHGTHDSLRRASPLYAEIYTRQLKPQEEQADAQGQDQRLTCSKADGLTNQGGGA